MKTILTIVITAALTALGAWFFLKPSDPTAAAASPSGERKVLYYQSAMHPWIKSDKPGRCTICGMELTPIYEGDPGFNESENPSVTTLTQNQIQVLHVQTSKVATAPVSRTLHVAGKIDDNASRHRVLASYIDGRIDQLHVNFVGAEVTEGQPLAEIYSPSLLQSEREYRQLSGEFKQSAALRLRQMGLTPAQVSEVAQKSADVLTSAILAPMSGTVVSQSVYAGQYVTTGQPLFEIADFSSMWFVFQAYETDLPWLRPGLSVQITTPSLPGKSFTSTISFIDPNLDEATRSTEVRVELPNPLVQGRREFSHRLYADGFVKIDSPRVLSVPRSAVIQTGTDAVAYVELAPGSYERRTLKLGRTGDSLFEVVSGLTENEAVVTNGNLLIDSQAEMNRSFATMTVATKSTQETPPPPQPAAAPEVMTKFLALVDAMSAALATDDLEKFNQASAPVMDLTAALIASLPADAPETQALAHARHFHGFADLKSARIAFHRFSVAATAVLEPLRKAGKTPDFQLYQCGMVDEAIPDVPNKARWIQTGGRPMANPFFGSSMPDCGKTIQP